jgi:hypothetical protein
MANVCTTDIKAKILEACGSAFPNGFTSLLLLLFAVVYKLFENKTNLSTDRRKNY